jgi:hypothetical protein
VPEIVLTPSLSRANIAHMVNLQRGLVGVATSNVEPSGLASVFGGVRAGGTEGEW